MPFHLAIRFWIIDVRKKSRTYHLAPKISRQRRLGFTLIELLVVIAIIGILTSLITYSFTDSQKKSRDSRRKSDLESIRKALELMKQDTTGNYSYPYIATPAALTSLNTTPAVSSSYIKDIPTDPKTGTGYMYTPLLSTGGSACTGTGACTAYTLVACLENTKDPQKEYADGDTSDRCGGSTANGLVGYVVTNL